MKTKTLILFIAATTFSGCCGVSAQAPAGFATYTSSPGSNAKNDCLHALSSDGVVFRVRCEDNEPAADLEFWREALKKRMHDAGYAFIREGEIAAQGHPGYLLELSAPAGDDDLLYLTAVFVDGDDLVLVEASGEVSVFSGRRQAVLDSIAAMSL